MVPSLSQLLFELLVSHLLFASPGYLCENTHSKSHSITAANMFDLIKSLRSILLQNTQTDLVICLEHVTLPSAIVWLLCFARGLLLCPSNNSLF